MLAELAFCCAVVGSALLALAIALFVPKHVIPYRAVDPDGRVMEPRGANKLKNVLSILLDLIGRFKHARVLAKISPENLEQFQPLQVDHPYFNESFYFHCTDEATGDLIVTRISRRGPFGQRSYVFILVYSSQYGVLHCEEDIPVQNTLHPEGCGMRFVCVEPNKTWRLQFRGDLISGYQKDDDDNEPPVRCPVSIDLEFKAETPLFVYFLNDDPICIAMNLSQEPWTFSFWRSCLRRVAHAHYEQYGRCRGLLQVADHHPVRYDMSCFRDHSWDVRRWAHIDRLCIILCKLKTPLVLENRAFSYLTVTICDMPGAPIGIQRFTSGWLGGPGVLNPLRFATSIDNIPYLIDRRRPLRRRLPPRKLALFCRLGNGALLKISCRPRPGIAQQRVQYWPDREFEVFEDSVAFSVKHLIEKEVASRHAGFGGLQFGFALDLPPSSARAAP